MGGNTPVSFSMESVMRKPSKRLLYQLLRTVELGFVLNNWCADENRKPKDFTLDELIGLASQRIDEFQEPGHTLNDGLMGTLGEEEQKYYETQFRYCNEWIRRAKAERESKR
jgi:hypothetical protein